MPKLSNATPKYRKHKACGGQVQRARLCQKTSSWNRMFR